MGNGLVGRVALAEVVVVRIALGVQILEPGDGARVLVGERDRGQLGAPGA